MELLIGFKLVLVFSIKFLFMQFCLVPQTRRKGSGCLNWSVEWFWYSTCGLLHILNFVPGSFCCEISFMWILPPYLCKDNQFRDIILFLIGELLIFPGVKFLISKQSLSLSKVLFVRGLHGRGIKERESNCKEPSVCLNLFLIFKKLFPWELWLTSPWLLNHDS